MIKLYDIICRNDNFPEKDIRDLYVKNAGRENSLKCGDVLDFLTYFNSFSSIKWEKYTTIKEVSVELYVQGDFEVTFVLQDEKGKKFLLSEEIADGHYVRTFPIEEIEQGILGFQLRLLGDEGSFISGAYYGEFDVFERKTIGVGICTYRREGYVLKNIEVLRDLRQKLPGLDLVVVDNGRTLHLQYPDVRLIPNKNFGGSGGFTRAIIEYMRRENKVDYILLMDDDVVIEPSALLRTWIFLGGLREEFRDRFLCGAMLRLHSPCIQLERSAAWSVIRSHSNGYMLNLADPKNLVANEKETRQLNQYGGWWYCCIPTQRISEIGYPLPVFIKGDDMEYGIRNNRPVLTMNGIAVWHQEFTAKRNVLLNYYFDRNMLMLNNFARRCNWLTFSLAVSSRLILRLRNFDKNTVKFYYLALLDYNSGLEQITKIGSDERFSFVQNYTEKEARCFIFLKAIYYAIYTIIKHPITHKKYLNFRKNRLQTSEFWKQFLNIE